MYAVPWCGVAMSMMMVRNRRVPVRQTDGVLGCSYLGEVAFRGDIGCLSMRGFCAAHVRVHAVTQPNFTRAADSSEVRNRPRGLQVLVKQKTKHQKRLASARDAVPGADSPTGRGTRCKYAYSA